MSKQTIFDRRVLVAAGFAVGLGFSQTALANPTATDDLEVQVELAAGLTLVCGTLNFGTINVELGERSSTNQVQVDADGEASLIGTGSGNAALGGGSAAATCTITGINTADTRVIASIDEDELDPLFEIIIASNRIYLSDFNRANFRQYRDIEVVLRDDDEISYGEQFGHERQLLAPFKQKQWLIESKYSEGTGEGQIFTSGLDFTNIVSASGTNNIQKSDGTLIESVTVPSGGTVNSPVADSPITVNGDAYTDLKATDSFDIITKDDTGAVITPLSISSPDIVFNDQLTVAVSFKENVIADGGTFENEYELLTTLRELAI